MIAFLNQSIDWYRRVQLPASADGSDSIYAAYNRNASVQTLALVFDFARAQAQQIQLSQTHQTASNSGETQPPGRNLPQLVAGAQDKVKQATADLDSLQQQAASAAGKKRQMLDDQVAEQKSELELAQARLEALQNMNAFATAGASAGLLGKINELERTVPEAVTIRAAERTPRTAKSEAHSADGNAPAPAQSTTNGQSESSAASSSGSSAAASGLASATLPPAPSPASTAQAATTAKPPSGIISLTSDLFTLTSQLSSLRQAQAATVQMRVSLDKIRDPLRKQLREINQRGEELSAQPQSTDSSVLEDRKKQIEGLTAEFRQLSSVLLPLAKASILLDASSNNLAEWRGETERNYTAEGRSLLLRILVLVGAIIAVGVASDFWRRAIFRYVRDQRRRNQFLLLRRIVVSSVVVLILIFGLSTEIGSLATFAGFLTAGIAVALQNVILSVAAYFFLIGRYGIRVGDRVQIGSVTGDVVDIGLIRLHLVELDTEGGEARPTGRVVVFSNSVVFQPTSNFFKQLPGSNFAWRKLSFTLAADVDYQLAQERISKAVNSVYTTYRPELEHQHRTLQQTLAIHITGPEPQTRLRLLESGLEIIVLYPVVLSRADEIDDRMTKTLLDALEQEPKLGLVGGGLTSPKPLETGAPALKPPAPGN